LLGVQIDRGHAVTGDQLDLLLGVEALAVDEELLAP